MGLDHLVFGAVQTAIDAVRRHRPSGRTLDVATLGYLDIVMTEDELTRAMGARGAARLTDRAGVEALRRSHHAAGIQRVPTLESFFAALDCRVTAFDFRAHVGPEVVWDMARPVPAEFRARFDLVIDGGTCEHVFDVAAALRNCASMTARGGCVVHANPLAMGNHAFYGFNPTLLHDFYTDNGFRVLRLEAFGLALDGQQRRYTPIPIHPTARFSLAVGMEAILLTVVQRTREGGELVDPIQSVYRPAEAGTTPALRA